jgi:membrane protease subunit HflK
VQVARADAEKAQNEAQRYANSIVPEARGKAAKIQQDSEAYREQTVAEAKGQAARFLKVYEEYKKAPEVTRQRIYYETMEKLFAGTDKIILDPGAATGAVPYLPLPELRPPQRPAQTTQPGGTR